MIAIYLLTTKKSLNLRPKTKVYQENYHVDFNQADRKPTGLYGYVYDFSVDYEAIANDKTVDIHHYLMKKKNNIV